MYYNLMVGFQSICCFLKTFDHVAEKQLNGKAKCPLSQFIMVVFSELHCACSCIKILSLSYNMEP